MRIYKVAQKEDNRITIKAFRNRFTMQEKIIIETASRENPMVKVFLDDVHASKYIDLNDQQLIDGLMALEQAQLIEAGRANEIHLNPIQANERYKD